LPPPVAPHANRLSGAAERLRAERDGAIRQAYRDGLGDCRFGKSRAKEQCASRAGQLMLCMEAQAPGGPQ
jgi:hypothetical protein